MAGKLEAFIDILLQKRLSKKLLIEGAFATSTSFY